MAQRKRFPVVLTIAGSDSGGGAGIQADLKTFAALGTHGTTAITCLTAQNPAGVRAIQAVRPVIVRQQVEAVFDGFNPAAIKTGMLFSRAIVREVIDLLRTHPDVPVVVDPVMVATSGAVLLQPSAIRLLQNELLPRATVMTPNVDEAAHLVGAPLRTLNDLQTAARALHRRHGCAVLVKGGHLRSEPEAVDVLFDGQHEWLLRAPFVRGVGTHGTGCTFSAAIAAHLAHGVGLLEAVRRAKQFVTAAIATSVRIGQYHALNPN